MLCIICFDRGFVLAWVGAGVGYRRTALGEGQADAGGQFTSVMLSIEDRNKLFSEYLTYSMTYIDVALVGCWCSLGVLNVKFQDDLVQNRRHFLSLCHYAFTHVQDKQPSFFVCTIYYVWKL